ncbi:MAG TPA: 2-oxoacid:ferredoxin oxidoreductase subunit beta [Candidatus Nanoarchaeia archaeon]|nr:2-oxoacid:ferredoxin oxidoreductase subunit beta [Candidatus Nanoarchaeia archaeon]
MAEPADFRNPVKPVWCPSCGNFGILSALRGALADSGSEPHQVMIVSGIGCHGAVVQYVHVNGFHSIHGRTLPIATGIKLANHDLKVIAMSGDGDGYGIGMGHFIHAMRRNLDITYIVHDNKLYSLTTGQTSPTSDKGSATKSTPFGSIEIAVNPLTLALSSGASFIARGFAGDPPHLRKLITEAIKHKGFSLIDVFQPCVTFNKVNTNDFYKERVYKLEDEGYEPVDKAAAYERAVEWNTRVPIGVIYKEDRATYEDEVVTIQDMPLVKRPVEGVDITKTMEQFM